MGTTRLLHTEGPRSESILLTTSSARQVARSDAARAGPSAYGVLGEKVRFLRPVVSAVVAIPHDREGGYS